MPGCYIKLVLFGPTSCTYYMKLLEGNQASVAPCNSFVMLDPRTSTQMMHGEV